jgi:hypothetical protein
MIVVADTTPLNYLVLIGQIELLSALYRTVLIPQEVHRELQQPGTPPTVRAWATNLPAWCEVRASSSTPDPALSELDPGGAKPSNLRWKRASTSSSWTKPRGDGKHYVDICRSRGPWRSWRKQLIEA